MIRSIGPAKVSHTFEILITPKTLSAGTQRSLAAHRITVLTQVLPVEQTAIRHFLRSERARNRTKRPKSFVSTSTSLPATRLTGPDALNTGCSGLGSMRNCRDHYLLALRPDSSLRKIMRRMALGRNVTRWVSAVPSSVPRLGPPTHLT